MPDLFLEIGTEELPPASIWPLQEALADALQEALEQESLLSADDAQVFSWSTPRRLAVRVNGVMPRQPDREEQRLGPNVAAAFKDGEPTPAAMGFAKSCGVDVDALESVDTPKGQRLAYRIHQPGRPATEVIPPLVEAITAKLPVAKPMRWGTGEYQFVRPVHWVVLMLDAQVLELELFGVSAENTTLGHRVMGNAAITLDHPDDYLDALRKNGVIVDPQARRATIADQISALASEHALSVDTDDALLDEITNLVEWPVALMGAFDPAFLSVPDELLISSMRGHQKCFAVRDGAQLTHRFVAVANIASTEPDRVREGFERVIAPRLADARFFWQRDLDTPLEQHRTGLDRVVFQRRLGSLGDKTERVTRLARWVANAIGYSDAEAIDRAGQLSRCDLLTETVGEFPELQGVAGQRLAAAQGESLAVAEALNEFYAPRFSGDDLPSSALAQCLGVADRLDTLAGIFAVGLVPKGNRDPFALRRAAVGLYRILSKVPAPVDIIEALSQALEGLGNLVEPADDLVETMANFVWDRARALLGARGVGGSVFDAVHRVQSRIPSDFERRLDACNRFRHRAEAESLAAANKRIVNLLKKSSDESSVTHAGDYDDGERALAQAVSEVEKTVESAVATQDYGAALDTLSTLQSPVDQFFESVMVMSEDREERARRINLLSAVRRLFLQVADVSRLEIEARG